MDFVEFKKSKFLLAGKYRWSASKIELYEDYICMYLTGLFLPPKTDEDIEFLIKYPVSDVITMLHIKQVLRMDDIMSGDFRETITRQWMEVVECVDKLNRSDTPTVSFLLIQEPGMHIPKHTHNKGVSQTITFCYAFGDDLTKNSINRNYLRVHNHRDQDKVEYMYPESQKFYFEVMNNNPHESYNSNKWIFYWVYDFPTYEFVPDSIGEWKKIS